MEVFEIQSTQDVPGITLDPDKGYLSFFGRSYPDDAKAIFSPVIEWLEKYIENNAKATTTADFKFTYFNTASSKMILEILDRLARLSDKGSLVTVNWYYKEVDDDMRDAGEEYSDIVQIPFNFIPYSN